MYKLNLHSCEFELNPLHADKTAYLQRWQTPELVSRLHSARSDKPLFLLHDGPPYANGHLHLGHFVNKVLKDALLKHKRLEGFHAPYLPGFDCHGLPVELEVEKQGASKEDPQAFVDACRVYAQSQVELQSAEFASFGVHADWQGAYRTMAPEFEADAARVFERLPSRTQRLRPVHWCAQCGSSLAEAEVEHKLKSSPSVEVLFPWPAEPQESESDSRSVRFLQVWTTTPYTLPANQAVGYHPQLEYVEVPAPTEECPQRVLVRVRRANDPAELPSAQLEGAKVLSPWSGACVPLLVADYVTAAGTGLVHLAPAFGVDDFRVCEQHRASGVKGLEVASWVGETGTYLPSDQLPEHARALAGLTLKDASAQVLRQLQDRGLVLRVGQLQHEYPHCWRHKSPLYFRASAQWFLELDELAPQALAALEDVQFFPDSGRERLSAMLRTRSSWCVSRQRLWGTPLVQSQEDLARLEEVSEEGVRAWHRGEARPTLDVWFDSGVTHELVLRRRFGRGADVYLEGTDQHRGWFQSSLLTSVALHGQAPFKQVLTHGFVVDEHGKKYSKSSGNYVPLPQLFKEHSPDVLRVWALSQDCSRDLKMSSLSLKQAQQRLRRLRNTLRFCLQNLVDFQVEQASVEFDVLQVLFLQELSQMLAQVRLHAQRYEFAPSLAVLSQFCEQVSAEFFPAWKDTLYCEAENSGSRRQVQTVLWHLAQVLVRALVPVAPYAAEDACLALGSLVGEGLDGRSDSAVLLTWAGVTLPGVTADVDAVQLRALRSQFHRRFEAHREGRSAWAEVEGAQQPGQVELSLGHTDWPQGWPATEQGKALLSQWLGSAAVGRDEAVNGVQARLAVGMSCPCCRRVHSRVSEEQQLCPRCEEVQAGALP